MYAKPKLAAAKRMLSVISTIPKVLKLLAAMPKVAAATFRTPAQKFNDENIPGRITPGIALSRHDGDGFRLTQHVAEVKPGIGATVDAQEIIGADKLVVAALGALFPGGSPDLHGGVDHRRREPGDHTGMIVNLGIPMSLCLSVKDDTNVHHGSSSLSL